MLGLMYSQWSLLSRNHIIESMWLATRSH